MALIRVDAVDRFVFRWSLLGFGVLVLVGFFLSGEPKGGPEYEARLEQKVQDEQRKYRQSITREADDACAHLGITYGATFDGDRSRNEQSIYDTCVWLQREQDERMRKLQGR
jgi:hypothetical protein